MKEWYLTTPIPNITSGYESDLISEYAQNNFTDVLETTFSDKVTLYNSDLSDSSIINCIVQGNVSNSQTKSQERTILFPIGTSFAGKYVFFDNSYWLLTGYPGNNKSYEKIIAVLCNVKLRWQNEDGNIIERWAHSDDFTRSSSGVSGNNTIVVGDDQYRLVLPIDEETKGLKRDMRFSIDFDDTNEPDIYMLTNRKVVSNNYQNSNKGGTIIFTLSFDSFNKDNDKLVTLKDGTKVWICNYFSPTTPPDPDPPDETANLFANITGNTNLKVGFTMSYLVNFTDKDGDVVAGVDFKWNMESDFADKISQTISGNTIKLQIYDDSLIGSHFLLSVLVEGEKMGDIEITVVEGF